MRLLHMADLHLDSKMETHLSKEQARERKNEMLQTFGKYIDYARNEGISAVLIAGDIFDTKNVLKGTVKTVRGIIEKYKDIKFYIIKGNHDSGDIISDMSDMENVFLFNDSWTRYQIDDEGKIILTGIELFDDNTEAFAGLLLEKDKVNIVMLHGQDTPGKSEKNVGVIPLKSLEYKGIDYMALGHIHRHKMGRIDNRGIFVYPGCMESRGFDEAGEHGAVVLDINEATGEISTKLINLESRSCIVVEVDITGCSSSADAEGLVMESLKGIDKRNMVKVVLTGELDIDADINLSYLQKIFEDDFYFIKLTKKTGLRIDMELYEREISLKGEFVRAVQADDTLTDEQKNAIIRMGIRTLRGEDIAYENYEN